MVVYSYLIGKIADLQVTSPEFGVAQVPVIFWSASALVTVPLFLLD